MKIFRITSNVFDVTPIRDTAVVQTVFPFSPNIFQDVLFDVLNGVDASSSFLQCLWWNIREVR